MYELEDLNMDRKTIYFNTMEAEGSGFHPAKLA